MALLVALCFCVGMMVLMKYTEFAPSCSFRDEPAAAASIMQRDDVGVWNYVLMCGVCVN